MTVLDKVQQMKMQGYSNGEIIKSLEEEGVSPREINDALSQSSIKEAMTGFSNQNLNGEYANMEQSVMSQEQPSQPPQENLGQFSQEVPQPGMEYNESYMGGYSSPYAKEQYQSEYQEQMPSYGASPETMSEIANQVVDEKISKITKALSSLVELKTLLSSKVEKIDDRLVRIEKIIDQLQMSMIKKSSDNEQNIDDIKSELREMQVGFSKIINPLVDKAREKNIRKRK